MKVNVILLTNSANMSGAQVTFISMLIVLALVSQ